MTKRKTKDDATGITVQHIPVKKERRKLKAHLVSNQLSYFEHNGLVIPIHIQVRCYSKILCREKSFALISLGQVKTKAAMEKEVKASRKAREATI